MFLETGLVLIFRFEIVASRRRLGKRVGSVRRRRLRSVIVFISEMFLEAPFVFVFSLEFFGVRRRLRERARRRIFGGLVHGRRLWLRLVAEHFTLGRTHLFFHMF